MYIEKVTIRNIKSISCFEMDFRDSCPGWHVLIGDNGSGKSSIVRSIALALIGPTDAQALRLPLIGWIQQGTDAGKIDLSLKLDKRYDSYSGKKPPAKRPTSFSTGIILHKEETAGTEIGKIASVKNKDHDPYEFIWSGKGGWFAASFGPFRRFTGGDKEWSKVYYSNPRAAAHLSVFGEDVALTECLEWLNLMRYKSYENNAEARETLSALQRFLNEGGLMPHGTKFKTVSSDGVVFEDGNGCSLDVNQLSDGFRSLLSMMFELIRQMVKTYGESTIFSDVNKGDMRITVPGVVLIDEVDAHLHPTWQTRIGDWLTRYFPNIQFIVTTHSPLVCRASERGSIWRLCPPGGEVQSGEITGVEKERLIYGNILDAYGTEAFGKDVSISESAIVKLDRLGELNVKSIMGDTTGEEEKELAHLKAILPTGGLK